MLDEALQTGDVEGVAVFERGNEWRDDAGKWCGHDGS
jgi:hypothetical protein